MAADEKQKPKTRKPKNLQEESNNTPHPSEAKPRKRKPAQTLKNKELENNPPGGDQESLLDLPEMLKQLLEHQDQSLESQKPPTRRTRTARPRGAGPCTRAWCRRRRSRR